MDLLKRPINSRRFVTWYVTGTTSDGRCGEAVQTNDDHDDLSYQCLLTTVTAKALRIRGHPSRLLRTKARSPSSISISESSLILISPSYKKGLSTALLWLFFNSLLTLISARRRNIEEN